MLKCIPHGCWEGWGNKVRVIYESRVRNDPRTSPSLSYEGDSRADDGGFPLHD